MTQFDLATHSIAGGHQRNIRNAYDQTLLVGGFQPTVPNDAGAAHFASGELDHPHPRAPQAYFH